MLSRKLLLLLISGALASGQTRQLTCANCHAKEAKTQPLTPMGRALLAPGTPPTLGTEKKLTFQSGKFTYALQMNGSQGTYNVSDGERNLTLPIQWTFGAGAQTYVLSRGNTYFESAVSYYPEIGRLDFTLGDERLNPQRLEDAIGRPLAPSVVVACFGCHSTSGVRDRTLHLDSLKPGLTCEHCHTDAPAHLNAVSALNHASKPVIPAKIGSRSAESISNFCGQCHRSWETVVRNNWRGEVNARFQPYRLANSKCFNGADRRISCLACHNPHEDLVTTAASYDSKCLACHGTVTASACKVAQSGCISCHMPKVKLPGGHQTFTDHFIRIAKADEPYPN